MKILPSIFISLLIWSLTACDTSVESSNHEYMEKRISQLERQTSFLERRLSEIEKQGSNHTKNTSPVIKRNITFELDDGYFDDPYFGTNDTSTIMIIYTDLRCKSCRDFLLNTLPELRKHFSTSDNIQIRIRDFPLSASSFSKTLAMAAHCAGEKGKYWEYLTQMLSSTIKSDQDIFGITDTIPEIEKSTFTNCINSGKYQREIELDKEHGKSLGIKGTPSIIIAKRISNRLYSGTMIRGNQPLGLLLDELNFLR